MAKPRIINTPLGRLSLDEAVAKSGLGKTTILYRVKTGHPIAQLFDPVHRPDRIHFICAQCGKAFSLLPFAVRAGTRFCSRECRLIGTAAKPLAERLDYIVDEDGCWIWQKGKDKDGYGLLKVQRPRRRTARAHVVSYELAKGPIPVGLIPDHLCKKPSCINSDHLEPVTPGVNVLRGNGACAKNARKTHCPEGHPYSGENLYVNPKGQRICRICVKEAQKRYRLRCEALQAEATR